MWDAEGGAERIADAVAGASRHAGGGRRDRLPHADLGLQPRRQVRRVALDGRQRAVEQLEALQRQRLGRQVGLGVAVVLAPRGRPSGCRCRTAASRACRACRPDRAPRCAARTGGGGTTAWCWWPTSVMPAFSVNSEADSVVDTATMRIGSARQHHVLVLVALEAEAIGLHGLGAVEAHPQAQLHALGGVDHRAATDRHQQIGPGLARGLGAGHHVLARAVRADRGVGADMARAQRLLHALQRPVLLLRQRARRGDEHAFGADPLGLGHHRLPGRECRTRCDHAR